MSRHRTLSTLTASLALLVPGLAVAAVSPAEATVALTEEQVADLSFTRDEERMALDLWTLFADEYPDAATFANIAESEQQHFDTIGAALDKYDLPDPSEGMPAGEYVVPAIQELYDTWEAEGLASLDDALQVGIDLETRDIEDLEALIAKDQPEDLEQVYTNLCDGSYDHLDAFTDAAEAAE